MLHEYSVSSLSFYSIPHIMGLYSDTAVHSMLIKCNTFAAGRCEHDMQDFVPPVTLYLSIIGNLLGWHPYL